MRIQDVFTEIIKEAYLSGWRDRNHKDESGVPIYHDFDEAWDDYKIYYLSEQMDLVQPGQKQK